MKPFQPTKPIVHFGPEWGVFSDDPSGQKPFLHSVHGTEWGAGSAVVRLREQGYKGELVIRQRTVYRTGWEPTETKETPA